MPSQSLLVIADKFAEKACDTIRWKRILDCKDANAIPISIERTTMRLTSIFALVLLTSCPVFCVAQESSPAPQPSQAGTQSDAVSPELVAVRAESQAFVDAFNQHDAKAVAALWTEDAEYVDDSGAVYVGGASIEEMYTAFFAENTDVKIQLAIDSLRLLSSGVAIEDGRALVEPAPAGAPGISKYTAVHIKVDGKWKMASVRDTWIETTVTRENMADLDWLIGKWVAEEQGNRSESEFSWVANNSFVQRNYTTTRVDGSTTSGVQLIGWNPIMQSVQSWNFSSDGGHATGLWSITQAGWAAAMTGVTGDGLVTTATNQLTRLDENAYVWQSIDRTVDGVELPDSDEVVIKRVSKTK